MTRAKAPAAAVPTAHPNRVAMPSGSWWELGPLTGRDLVTILDLNGRQLTQDTIRDVFGIIERRTVASSLDDPLDAPIAELVEMLITFAARKEAFVVPPASASS